MKECQLAFPANTREAKRNASIRCFCEYFYKFFLLHFLKKVFFFSLKNLMSPVIPGEFNVE